MMPQRQEQENAPLGLSILELVAIGLCTPVVKPGSDWNPGARALKAWRARTENLAGMRRRRRPSWTCCRSRTCWRR